MPHPVSSTVLSEDQLWVQKTGAQLALAPLNGSSSWQEDALATLCALQANRLQAFAFVVNPCELKAQTRTGVSNLVLKSAQDRDGGRVMKMNGAYVIN